MGGEVKKPRLLMLAAVMVLSLGIGFKILGITSASEKEFVRDMSKISKGGNPDGTHAYEQAVNRYNMPKDELIVPFDLYPEEYIKANDFCLPLLDEAVKCDRINFRRDWAAGFEVSPIGVIDIANLSLLNYSRMNAPEWTPAESIRLADSIRTLAGYLEYDPMVRNQAIYAPAMHIYLFALEKNCNRGVYSAEELEKLLAQLVEDDAKYSEIFANAVDNERNMLFTMPQTLKNVMPDHYTSFPWKNEGEFAGILMNRYNELLKDDFYINKETYESILDYGDKHPIADRLVPTIEYAQRLASLQNHNRLAQLVIAAELDMRNGNGVDFSRTKVNALTGEELKLTPNTTAEYRASIANPTKPEDSFSIKHPIK